MKLCKSWKCRHQGSSNVIPASNNHTVEVMNKDFLDLFEEEKNLILLQRIKNIIRTFVFVYIAAYYVKQSIENQKYTCLWILISEGFFIVPTPTVTLDLSWKKNNGSRNSTQDEVLLSVNWLMTERVWNGDWITFSLCHSVIF